MNMLTVLLTREHNFRFLLLTTLIYRIEFLPAPTQMTMRMDRLLLKIILELRECFILAPTFAKPTLGRQK